MRDLSLIAFGNMGRENGGNGLVTHTYIACVRHETIPIISLIHMTKCYRGQDLTPQLEYYFKVYNTVLECANLLLNKFRFSYFLARGINMYLNYKMPAAEFVSFAETNFCNLYAVYYSR